LATAVAIDVGQIEVMLGDDEIEEEEN